MPTEVEYRLIASREGKLDPWRGRKVINLTSYEARPMPLTRMIHDHACTRVCTNRGNLKNPSLRIAILLFRERDEGLHARLSPRKDDEYRDSYEIVPTTYSPTLDDIAYIYPYFIKRSVRVTRLKKRDADSQQGIGKHSSAGQQERPNVFETRYASRMI